MRKGITPIISVIILLLITVALAGTAWTYMSGIMNVGMSKSFSVQPGAAFCDASHTIRVRVVNTGTSAITTSDWSSVVMAPASGTSITLTAPASSVAPKAMGEFTGAGGVAGTTYTGVLSTVSASQPISVTC